MREVRLLLGRRLRGWACSDEDAKARITVKRDRVRANQRPMIKKKEPAIWRLPAQCTIYQSTFLTSEPLLWKRRSLLISLLTLLGAS